MELFLSLAYGKFINLTAKIANLYWHVNETLISTFFNFADFVNAITTVSLSRLARILTAGRKSLGVIYNQQ